eukprot:m.188720 g.188720  ORF g.188720 m.188720 type:complete len:80 (-) comp32356_c1_seq1:1872-2111(-)
MKASHLRLCCGGTSHSWSPLALDTVSLRYFGPFGFACRCATELADVDTDVADSIAIFWALFGRTIGILFLFFALPLTFV